jgi:hypothetical protein
MHAGNPTWTTRGLLDFNVVFGLHPSAMPPTDGAYSADPERSAYALLKEGFAWVSLENRLMVLVESVGACGSAAEVPVYNYSARAFYGARGELPGLEFNEQGDYTGYQQLQCMNIVVHTGFSSNPGQRWSGCRGACQPWRSAPATWMHPCIVCRQRC